MKVSVLFTCKDSYYHQMEGVECYDIQRDARTFTGSTPVVAHPPCRAWGKLKHFARPRLDEKELAIWAISQIRKCGGVLEHPSGSSLWPHLNLPTGRNIDQYGGWTLKVDQLWWGHEARKTTLLYICGVKPSDIPDYPITWTLPNGIISTSKGKARNKLPEISKKLREKTPPDFAEWLVKLATLCKKPNEFVK